MATDFGFDVTSNPQYFFVSYNTEDADRVASICNVLHRNGLPIWYDNGIPHDSYWESVIAEKIDNCVETIFFITKGIFDKAKGKQPNEIFTYKEYDLAKRYRKKILVVILDEVSDKNDVPYSLMSWWQEIDPNVRQGIIAYNDDSTTTASKILKALGFKDAHSIQDDISLPVINSVIDHPIYGDEREFVHIREYGDQDWHRSVPILSGRQYEVDILIRNDALPKYNFPECSHQGVSINTKMAIDLPYYIKGNDSLTVRIFSTTARERIDSVELIADDGKLHNLQYIAGSARISNHWRANGSVLSINLFRYNRGTLLGLNELNGVIPGGDKYISHVRFVFQANAH